MIKVKKFGKRRLTKIFKLACDVYFNFVPDFSCDYFFCIRTNSDVAFYYFYVNGKKFGVDLYAQSFIDGYRVDIQFSEYFDDVPKVLNKYITYYDSDFFAQHKDIFSDRFLHDGLYDKSVLPFPEVL